MWEIRKILKNVDLEKESKELKAELKESTGQKKVRIGRRLEVVEAFRHSGNKPEWMIMDTTLKVSISQCAAFKC